MDIEVQFEKYPLVASAFVMSCLLAVAFLAAFFMQWHPLVLLERSWQSFKQERKKKGNLRSGLKWYFFGDYIEAWRVLKENKGSLVLLPIGLLFSLAAWVLYGILMEEGDLTSRLTQ